MDAYRDGRQFLKADGWEGWREYQTDQRQGLPPPPVQKPYPQGAVLVDLEDPDRLGFGDLSLKSAFERRRSCRKFIDKAISLDELSFLLWATQGIDQQASLAFRKKVVEMMDVTIEKVAVNKRTAPSAGACHPFETYLLVSRVGGLAPGVYRYLPLEHKLLYLKSSEQAARDGGDFVSWTARRNSAVVFLWTVIPYRTEWRYAMVAHKMIAQESGHICQNLYLACQAVGAGTCAVGAYDQAEVDRILGVDGEEEFTIYVAPTGKV